MPPSLWALSTLHGTCVPERPSLPLCPAGGAYTHPPARKCTWAREHTPAHKCTPCPLGPRFPAIKGHVFPRPSHPWACRGPPSPCTCLPHAHDTDRHPRGHTPTALSFPRRRRGQRPPPLTAETGSQGPGENRRSQGSPERPTLGLSRVAPAAGLPRDHLACRAPELTGTLLPFICGAPPAPTHGQLPPVQRRGTRCPPPPEPQS